MTTPVYQDASRPINERVSDLLQQMTLDEKLAQLGSFWVHQVIDEVVLDLDKAAALMPNGIGHVTRVGGASNVTPV